ncbi:MAG: ABC transporter substrate-binding protein [Xanthobacteraceae bacterium]|nr:ABC transporter substrate-binding protein [Xanthobacteraceae bacterium]
MMKLEYGIPQDKGATHLRFGIAKGFFRDEGLDVSLRVVFGGPEIASCYDSGELKIGEMGTPPATTALSKGARFKIVASGIRRRALQYLVANRDIKGETDLRGKNIGVLSKGSCSYWFARLILQGRGLDPDRHANVIGLGPRHAEVIELFETGDLQAGVLSEPTVSIGEYRGAFHMMRALSEPEFCPSMQWSVTVANCGVIEREPELVRAVLRACKRSYQYSAENDDEFAEFGAEHYGIDKATMLRSMERERSDLHHECKVDMAGLDLAIDLQRRLGAFSVPMRAGDITDLRYLP